jgi:MerR family transcriptional regulator, mercuric resistance operon regulatory protein
MSRSEMHFQIGILSQRTGCNIETIRYYEKIGLLAPPIRSGGGYRQYDIEHLKRLSFIRRAREIGFNLDEVRKLLKLADDRIRSCDRARDLASIHLTDIKSKISDLKRIQSVLEELVSRCGSGVVPECPLIDALFQVQPADRVGRAQPPQRARSAKSALPT